MKGSEKNPGVIIIGWINKGKPADCGETMKNQLMIQRLSEVGVKCRIIDIKGWRKRPWVFIQLAWSLIFHKNDTIIFSSSAGNTYPMMKIMHHIKWNQKTVHWVIGGLFGERVKKGYFDKKIIQIIDHTLVESPLMKEQLDECDIKDVRVIPNFKPISYFPDISWKKNASKDRKIRFVYLSRIIPQKGCDYILKAIEMLNGQGLEHRFEVDFFGKIDDAYKEHFLQNLFGLKNAKYSGFLNLTENAGYDTLSKYDMMLFPTFWRGEGFAGIFIDAQISGLPIIATDWMHNKYFLKEGKTATFIPVCDAEALASKMEACISGEFDLYKMAAECQESATTYDVENVITKDLLKEINIL